MTSCFVKQSCLTTQTNRNVRLFVCSNDASLSLYNVYSRVTFFFLAALVDGGLSKMMRAGDNEQFLNDRQRRPVILVMASACVAWDSQRTYSCAFRPTVRI